jgi:hypothetical protein
MARNTLVVQALPSCHPQSPAESCHGIPCIRRTLCLQGQVLGKSKTAHFSTIFVQLSLGLFIETDPFSDHRFWAYNRGLAPQ